MTRDGPARYLPFKNDQLQIDGAQIQAGLFDFAAESTAKIAGAANTIARSSDDSTIRELALTWKIRLASATQQIVLDPDPR